MVYGLWMTEIIKVTPDTCKKQWKSPTYLYLTLYRLLFTVKIVFTDDSLSHHFES